jgi:hypothetical protein
VLRYTAVAEGQRFAVTAWSAWTPRRETPVDWYAWAGAADETARDADVDSGALPMMLRRRATALGQKMISSALACGEAVRTGRYVLASRHGEFSRTLRILDALLLRELPSPADFSMSVHNGLAGLLSIHSGNMRGHTALAAGTDTFCFGLMESAACLAEQPQEPVLFFFGDESLSGEFATFGGDDVDLPLVVALALQTPGPEDDVIRFDAVPRDSGAPPSTAAAIDFLRFLLSGEEAAVSAGVRMTWMWRRAT